MNRTTLRLRNNRSLKYGGASIPMMFGIVNVTSDSFSDGGRFLDPDYALRGALEMLDAGACAVDLGAESTRPGAEEAPAALEIERLVPVVKELKKLRPDAVVSIDTRKAPFASSVL